VIRGIEDTSAYVQLAPGLNLFGMPVNVPTTPAPYNASALLSNVLIPGETGQVDRYTGTVFGGWPDDGDNFDLSDGEGYLLYLENGKTVRFRGVKDCPTVLDLAAGLNVVTIPCTSDALNAYSLLSQLGPGVIFSIVRFNSASGMFETAAFNGGDIVGTNFSIVRGEAYLVNMNASVPSFSPAQ